jgi:hypothetical protein
MYTYIQYIESARMAGGGGGGGGGGAAGDAAATDADQVRKDSETVRIETADR